MVKLTSNAECPGKLSVERHAVICTIQMKAGCITDLRLKKRKKLLRDFDKLICEAPFYALARRMSRRLGLLSMHVGKAMGRGNSE
jgi:hypothetical protein